MKKLLRSKKGITMTELIVAMLVLTILIMTVTSVLSPILRTYYRANDFAETNLLLDDLSNILLNDISKAESGTITANGLELVLSGKDRYSIEYSIRLADKTLSNRGYLYRRDLYGGGEEFVNGGSEYYRGSYTSGKMISVRYQNAAGGIISGDLSALSSGFYVHIDIYDSDGDLLATRPYAVDPLVITLKNA